MPSEPWERLLDETPAAHRAFRTYRDLPPAQRAASIRTSGGRRSWASRHDWVARVAAWDDEQHRVEDAARLDALRTMHRTHQVAGRSLLQAALLALRRLDPETLSPSEIATLARLGAQLERDTLTTSVKALQGQAVVLDVDDPWDRIAAELTGI